MQVTLTFDEIGVPDNFQAADIINRACDMVMDLMFPEFEEHDVIDHAKIEVSDWREHPILKPYSRVTIPITVEFSNPF